MLHAPFLAFVVLVLIKYIAELIVMESFCNNIQSPVTFTFILFTGLLQVVIMLVIDKENDRALLSRQSRFVPRMWSCLAGFIEVDIKHTISYLQLPVIPCAYHITHLIAFSVFVVVYLKPTLGGSR
jgi:hypothetical protein